VWGWLLLLWGIYLTECIVSISTSDATLQGRRPTRFRASLGPQFSRLNSERGWCLLSPSPWSLTFIAGGESWDIEEAIERVARFSASTRVLSILATVLGVALLIVTPALIITSRISAVLLEWLVLLVLLDVAVIVAFVRTRRRTPPGARPMKPLVLAIASPIAAIRLPATLSLDVLRDIHPIAAIIAFANDEDALAYARRAWFDEPDERKKLEKALRKRELFNVLLAPPPEIDTTAASYCPRCRQQYSKDAESCADCERIQLVPLRA
jgi:hypothetical protein